MVRSARHGPRAEGNRPKAAQPTVSLPSRASMLVHCPQIIFRYVPALPCDPSYEFLDGVKEAVFRSSLLRHAGIISPGAFASHPSFRVAVGD